MNTAGRQVRLFGLLTLALAASLLLNLEAWQWLPGGDPPSGDILHHIRLPRALLAIGIGALLAMAGLMMQALLGNPLAEPYTLGAAGGAGAVALLCMLAGVGGLWLVGGAFAGALGSLLLVLALARSWKPQALILAGITLATGWAALILGILQWSPDQSLRGMLFWLSGDLNLGIRPVLPLLTALFTLTVGAALATRWNVMMRGDAVARGLGEHPGRLRGLTLVLAALITAVAVSHGGVIGFVGLIVPHLARLSLGSDHRRLLPACALGGAIALLLCEWLSRQLLAPRLLPIGVVTALLGIPMFLLLLGRYRQWLR